MKQSAVAQLLFLFCLIDAAPTQSPLQVIPPLAGYVPVYIRRGDRPLEEINRQLAEAFLALEAKSAHVKSHSGHRLLVPVAVLPPSADAGAHIQKIPSTKHKN